MVDEAELAIEQELLRLKMDDSRDALTQKLEQLEEKVTSTVETATATVAEATANVMETVQTATATVSETVGSVSDAVQGTVDSVRQTVEGTVGSVKDTFDLEKQTQARPWLMIGGAALLGYVAGRMLIPAAPRQKMSGTSPARSNSYMSSPAYAESRNFATGENAGYPLHGPARYPASFNGAASSNGSADFGPSLSGSNGSASRSVPAESLNPSATAPQAGSSSEPKQPSWWMEKLGPELNRLQGLAIGTALGLAREVLVEAAPEPIQQSLGEIIDGFTTKLGGQRIEGSMLSSIMGSSEHASNHDDDQLSSSPPYKIPR